MIRSVLILPVVFLLTVVFAFAAPNLINYQGMLTDGAGTTLIGTQTLTFALFNAATAGTEQWSETQTVSMQNGSYNVLLGSVTPFSASLFDNSNLWLEVRVGSAGSQQTLSPRQQLTSVPYALQAQTAQTSRTVIDGAITSAQLAPSVITLDQLNCPQGQGLFHTAAGWECRTAINLKPGDQLSLPCYDGAPATRNVGACLGGTRIWTSQGAGGCVGQVLPATRQCVQSLDHDCNGTDDCRDICLADDAQEGWRFPDSLSGNIGPFATRGRSPDAASNALGEAIVVWAGDDASFISHIFKSEFRAGQWTHSVAMNDAISPAGQSAITPQVAMDNNGNAIIVWLQDDGTNYQVYKSEFRNGVWIHPNSLADHINSTGTNVDTLRVAMADNGDAVILWSQLDGTTQRIFRKEYRNGSWSNAAIIPDTMVPARSLSAPQLAMDANGNTLIVWVRSDGTTDRIFKSEFRNGGWSDPAAIGEAINNVGTSATAPQVAMSNNGAAVIAWYQWTSSVPGYQVFASVFNGSAWGPPALLRKFFYLSAAETGRIPIQISMDDFGHALVLPVMDEFLGGTWTALQPLPALAPSFQTMDMQAVQNTYGNVLVGWVRSDGSQLRLMKSAYRYGVWKHPGSFSCGVAPFSQVPVQLAVALSSGGHAVIAWEAFDGTRNGIFIGDNLSDGDGDGFTPLVDCQDANPAIHPGAVETGGDGIDSNCDSFDFPDADGDHYGAEVDCNDGDSSIHPGAIESCNGIDDDCDGVIDNGFDLAVDPFNCGTCGNDCTASGYPQVVGYQCVASVCEVSVCASGWYDLNGISADGCEEPCGTVEICGDGIDNNCDGQVDNSCSNSICGTPRIINPANLGSVWNGNFSGLQNHHDPRWTTGVCGGLIGGGADVIFEFTPAVTAYYQIDTFGSAADIVLYLLSDCSLTDSCLAGVDNAAGEEVLQQQLQSGTTYYIVVDTYLPSSGSYALNIDYSPDGTTCDDGDLCTTGDVTTGGVCGGTPVVCNDGNALTIDSCNPADGQCVFTPVPDGTACDDGDLCTTGDVTTGGVCGGTPVVCNDSNPWTTDSCNPIDGQCVYTAVPDGTTCDDGDLCTTSDVTTGGVCGGTPVVCNDSNPWTTDSCNPADGQCVYTAVPDGTTCDDKNLCTTGDVTTGGVCGGTPVVCNDSNPWTTDNCNPADGLCVYTPLPDGTACDDANECTSGDVLELGICRGAWVADGTICGVVGKCLAGACIY